MRRVRMQDIEQLNFRIKLLSERLDKVESMNFKLQQLEKDIELSPRFISSGKAASYLGISPSFLQRLINDKCIPITRIRRKVLIDKMKLDEWIAANNNAQ